MAKKEESAKTVLERQYIVPIRRRTLGVPKYRKAKKAVITVREFISKHMKSDDVHIGKYLNEHIWNHGMKNPPGKVKVTASKNSEGKVFVELFGAPKEKPKEEKKGKKVAKDAKKESPKEAVKEAEIIKEEVKEMKEHKTEEAKKVEHEEIKELRKEHPHQHAPKMPGEPKTQELRKKEMIPPQRNG